MDPVTQAFSVVALILTSADEVFDLIGKLTDHARTLDSAESDRRHASARLDDDGGPPVPTAN